MTGAQITLLAVGLTEDDTEVHFTLAPNVAVRANILSFETESAGTVKIVIKGPKDTMYQGTRVPEYSL